MSKKSRKKMFSTEPFYISMAAGGSTDVGNLLQIGKKMQNKANVKIGKIT
jgi:hypothetical protein